MARARNIKPGFFTNDLLAELDPLARILFAGLWTIADRDGRLEDRPKKIKAQVLPYDECDCDALLTLLDGSGFILRYEIAGSRFIQIVKWAEHQNPHVKESESTIPAPDKHGANVVPDTTQTGTSPADSLNPITDSLNPITSSKREYSDEFEEAWTVYPPRPGASKPAAYKAWNARLKAGSTADEMIAGAKAYARYVREKGTDPEFIKQAVTFFGPGEHYKADWTVLPSRASPHMTANDKAKNLADRLTGNHRNERTVIDITPSDPHKLG